MGENLDIFGILREIKHSQSTKIVYVKGLQKRIVKVHTSSTVYHYLNLVYKSLTTFWGQTKTAESQVTSHWKYPELPITLHLRFDLEQGFKNFRLKYFL